MEKKTHLKCRRFYKFFQLMLPVLQNRKNVGYLILKKKFSSDYLQGSSCVLRLQQVRKGKTILVKRREGRGRRGERVGGGGIQGNRGMSNVFQQQTSYSVYIHCCTSSIHVAKGADHVPVSHHAAVAALSTASHYCYYHYWSRPARSCYTTADSNLQLHFPAAPRW